MNNVHIYKDKDIGLYTIEVDGGAVFECLAADEVVDIIKELLEKEN